MKVVSVGGIANDGDDYDMWLGRPYSQPAAKLEQIEREGGDPVIGRARRQALAINLSARIYGATEDATTALREALLAALDTETAAVALIVSDDDDGNVRYRYVVCTSVDEQPKGEGTGQHLTATLVTHGETRWRANTAHSETWEVTASGDTLAVTNAGSLAARPVYTVRPTDAKSSPDNAFGYRMFTAIKWPSNREAHRYPVDIVNGLWDTETLINDTKISAETNIAVVVNGKQARRWIARYDAADTAVWINLDFAPRARTRLLVSVGSGDTVEEIAAAQDITDFPDAGILQIGNEIFTYDTKDNALRVFQGVTRAAKGSTAAAHTGGTLSSGDTIDWIQHDVWVLYGGTGTREMVFDDDAPDTYWYVGYDGYKPLFTLDGSGNTLWWYEEFGESGEENKYRAAAWKPGGPETGTATIDDPYDQMILTRPFEGLSGYSWWELPAAYFMGAVRVIGSGRTFYPGTWNVAVRSQGVDYLAIPEPTPGAVESDFVDFDLSATGTAAGNEEVRIEQRSRAEMEARIDEVFVYWGDYPVATMAGEIEAYDLALTLENVTTGLSMTLTLAMALDEQLEVDTTRHTVTLLDDGSSQYQALSKSTRRREMLALAPGVNTLKVTESGLVGVTVQIEFEERTYS